MPAPRFAKSFRARLPGIATPAALARMAWAPSYRAPRAVDVFHPERLVPTERPTWSDLGAKDVVVGRDRVESLSLSGRSFVALAGPWVESNRPREVRLVAVKWYLDELAACPPLARVERLNLSGNRIGPDGMRILASSPHITATHLDLSNNDLGAEGVAEVLKAPWRHRLRGLNLARNGLGLDDLRNVVAAVPGIVELDVSGNEIGPEAVDVLAIRGGWKRLTLSETGIGVSGFADLVKIDELDVSFNSLGNGVLGRLPRVRVLSLRGNRLTRLDRLALSGIESLDLGANDFGDAGLWDLAAAPGCDSLRRLDLSNALITAAAIRTFRESGRFARLERLCLDWNA